MPNDDLMSLHRRGLTDSQIAKRLRLSIFEVWQIRGRLALSKNGTTRKKSPQFDTNAALALRRSGLKDDEIGRYLGVRKASVRQALGREGKPKRRRR